MGLMWKAGQLCLLFFLLKIKASLAQGQSTCTSAFPFSSHGFCGLQKAKSFPPAKDLANMISR